MTIEAPKEVPVINPATTVLLRELERIGTIAASILRVVQQGQDSPPGVIPLSAVNVLQTSRRFFVQYLVISGSAAGAYGLRIGTANVVTIQMGVADTKIIPFPYTIDSGKEVSIALSGGAALVDAFIIATTDEGS
jgi:hypothetical protein